MVYRGRNPVKGSPGAVQWGDLPLGGIEGAETVESTDEAPSRGDVYKWIVL
jgi:hypothetical protein